MIEALLRKPDMSVPRERLGWERLILWVVASQYPNGVFGEIGYGEGRSATALALAAQQVGGMAYSIEIRDTGRKALEDLGLEKHHRLLRGDSKVTAFPEKLDILFIDGDHDYDAVKADYFAHRDSVKPGGLIFFHDPISWGEGVGRFLIERGIFFLPIGAGLGIEVVKEVH